MTKKETELEPLLQKKLISTFENWVEDLKKARDDYKASAEVLDKARLSFEKNTESVWKQIIRSVAIIAIPFPYRRVEVSMIGCISSVIFLL